MIRINLLGAAKPKNKKPVITTGGVSFVFVGTLIMLVLAGAGNYYYWWNVNSKKDKLDTDLRQAEIENRRLSDVKTSYVEREKVKDNYKRRVDVIDQLRNNQMGPVSLLTMIKNTVDSTDEVWLNAMNDNGATIELKGTALSVNGVADLLHALQTSGYFKSVEINETYQDSRVKETEAFFFSLTCEKAAQSPAPSVVPAKGNAPVAPQNAQKPKTL